MYRYLHISLEKFNNDNIVIGLDKCQPLVLEAMEEHWQKPVLPVHRET